MFFPSNLPMFTELKIAQMGAFFLGKEGGVMPHLKLIKLLYLSDRKSMEVWGYPVSYDRMVSLPHGPVLSYTLEYINGQQQHASYWNSWISDKSNHKVSLNKKIENLNQLDQLSEAELKVMDTIWREFGDMDQWEISAYTHNHCHEWRDPSGSSYPISYEAVFTALGKSAEEALLLQQDIEAAKKVDNLFAEL